MSLDKFIAEIMVFIEKQTQVIIAELQRKRFENQGAFNGNEQWKDNSPKVIKDKGRNSPLVDSGELESELENPDNWDLKPKRQKNLLTLTIPDTEEFTDSKYDILQTGGKVDPYISRRGKYIDIHSVPSRNFKNLSRSDIQWIENELVRAIKREFT